MKIDIVFPCQNEEKFIQIAEQLGFDGLCLVFRNKKQNKKIKDLQKKTNLKLFSSSDIKIQKSSKKDQNVLEKHAPDLLYCPEFVYKKDSVHFRSSGLNQVLCKLAKKNKTIISIALKPLVDSKEKTKIIGRIVQNIRLCQKFKIAMAIASFAEHPYEMKSANDLISFGISLGMNIPYAKSCLNSVAEKIQQNKKEKSPEYIRKGVEISKP